MKAPFSSLPRLLLALVAAAGLMVFSFSVAHAQDTTQTPQDTTQQAPPPAPEAQAAGENLVSTLEAHGNFTTLVSALEQTGLAEQLQSSGQRTYTLFAPTDAAFEAVSLDSFSAEQLRRILRYHLVSDRVTAEEAVTSGSLEAAQGGALTIEEAAGGVTVNGATVSEADIEASNGVIHVIDGVLTPEAPTGGPTTQEDTSSMEADTTGGYDDPGL